jgi:diaminobutyrate-2-oxoglutarate transaminase
VRRLCTEHGVIVIADEIQAGVGRTGPFFSFEGSGLDPDIICVSKSLSGLGLPLAVNLLRPELDVWAPGEFTGTFRGGNLALATSRAMLDLYWSAPTIQLATECRGVLVRDALEAITRASGQPGLTVTGRGLLWGLHTPDGATAAAIAAAAFERRLLVETCGPGGATVKLLPPLVTEDADLLDGLARLADAVTATASRRPAAEAAAANLPDHAAV